MLLAGLIVPVASWIIVNPLYVIYQGLLNFGRNTQ